MEQREVDQELELLKSIAHVCAQMLKRDEKPSREDAANELLERVGKIFNSIHS
ncbi:MAG: hypothetical protein WC055_00100 [Melioribacteraceae bacterium]